MKKLLTIALILSVSSSVFAQDAKIDKKAELKAVSYMSKLTGIDLNEFVVNGNLVNDKNKGGQYRAVHMSYNKTYSVVIMREGKIKGVIPRHIMLQRDFAPVIRSMVNGHPLE